MIPPPTMSATRQEGTWTRAPRMSATARDPVATHLTVAVDTSKTSARPSVPANPATARRTMAAAWMRSTARVPVGAGTDDEAERVVTGGRAA